VWVGRTEKTLAEDYEGLRAMLGLTADLPHINASSATLRPVPRGGPVRASPLRRRPRAAGTAGMTVSHDAYSKMTTEARGPGNPATHTWTHTPSGTPKAALVWVTTGNTTVVSGDNAITGVTYGGVSMTLVTAVYGATGERGNAWLYELLSGVPTGAQTVAIAVNAMPTSISATYPFWIGRVRHAGIRWPGPSRGLLRVPWTAQAWRTHP